MAEGCEAARLELPEIFPGSWIDGNFSIWIGHADDRKAWSQLADAREVLDAPPALVGEEALMRAREEILIAEGSDWFWWYGDDHSSEHDLEFDDLFRRHVRNVYRLMDRTPPDELLISNISTGIPGAPVLEPTSLMTPILDGERTSYFEWLGAGSYEVRDVMGAMHQIDRSEAILTAMWFGFDQRALYVRLDAKRRADDLLAQGYACGIRFLDPDGLQAVIRRAGGTPAAALNADGRSVAALEMAAGSVLEVAIPIAALTAGQATAVRTVRFFVTLAGADGVELEQHPPHQPVNLALPDERFAAAHWRA
jgi:hypothetical protein